MVGPTVAHFKDTSERLLLCATPATIRSGIYQNAFSMIGKDITILPIPDLAGAIEFGKSEEEIRGIIAHALNGVPTADHGVLILACTHYPLVLSLFTEAVPASVYMFDPAIAVARHAKKLFWPQEVGNGSTRFVISKESALFRALVGRLFEGQSYSVEVIQ